MDINIPENINFVIKRLESRGFEAYIVGGCVRDSLMGLTPDDYDVTTNALPEQIKNCFSDTKTIDTGIKHGTVTVVSGGENVEITTYRVDGEYKDFRRPETVSFTDKLTEDLSRRDFTINAMCYSHRTGIIDKFGGQRDLFNHLIRCVGEPKKRFGEDALRILRALRFASRFDFSIEPTTSLAIHEMCGLVNEVSAERIRTELVKLLCGKAPAEILIEYSDVFTKIIPEFKRCLNFEQHSSYHIYDVWEHTAYSVENSSDDPYVRTALFFHDIEKPSCFRYDEEGEGHFPNHEKKGADTAENIMRRLKFDNKTIDIVSCLIRYHYVTPVDDKIVVKKLLWEIGEKNLGRLIEVIKGDSRAMQSFCLDKLTVLDAMKIRMYDVIRSGECYKEDMLALKGDDIAAEGFVGKEIGDALHFLVESVIDGRVKNERSELMKALFERKAKSSCGEVPQSVQHC